MSEKKQRFLAGLVNAGTADVDSLTQEQIDRLRLPAEEAYVELSREYVTSSEGKRRDRIGRQINVAKKVIDKASKKEI